MGEKLKIAMLGQKRVPSHEGGIEIVVEELSTRMAAKGHDVTLYNRGGHHVSGKEFDSQKLTEYKSVKLKSVPTIDRKGLAAVSSSFFGALRAAFGKYDVVHFHAEGPCAFMWIPKLFGKRCVATVHGLDWQREKWKGGFGSKFIHYGEKQAVKQADEIIVLSKGMQDYFLREYGRETVLIPNGVNKPEVVEAKEIKDRWGLEKDGYILFLGRIVPEKGLRYLVKAYEELKTDKKLVIAGGASDTDKFVKYKSEHPNIIKYFKKENEGLGLTRNYGMKRANGNYVVFVDSDDYIEKDMITQMMQCAVDNNADIVASSFVYNGHTQAEVGGEKLYIGKKEIQSLINRMSGNKNCKTNDQFNVSACTKLYSKECDDWNTIHPMSVGCILI